MNSFTLRTFLPKRIYMKNRILLLISMVSVLGCDRLKVDEQTKIQIQLPQAQNVMMSKNSLTTLAGRPVPSGFTGATPINCYLIAAGGPEESMQRNTCGRKDSAGSVGAFTQRKIGPWVGAAPAGSAIGIDVPSGKDRVIYVVGFHATSAAACRDFRTNGFPLDSELSDPYLMAEKGALELKPGETKDLPLEVSFKEENRFDGCDGPDFPDHDGNGDGGGSSTPTRLVVAKEWFPYNTFATDNCQSFDLIFRDEQGRHSSFSVPTQVTPSVADAGTSTPLTVYSNYQDCQASINSVSAITIPAFTDRTQVVFKTPASETNINVAISSITAPTALTVTGPASFPVIMGSNNTFDLEGPYSVLPDICYPFDFKLKQILGGPGYNGSTLTAALVGTGASIFTSLADCTSNTSAQSSLTFGMYSTSIPVYLRMSSAATDASFTFTSSGYTPGTRVIRKGHGTNTPVALEVRGFNQMSGLNTCSGQPHEVYLVNQYHTPVVATTAVPVSLSATLMGTYGSNYDCDSGTSPISSTSIPAGSIKGLFYLRPTAFGNGLITATSTGYASSTHSINIEGPSHLTLSSSAAGSSRTNNDCVEMTANLYMSTGLLAQNSYRSLNLTVTGAVTPSSYSTYSDAACTTSLPYLETPMSGPATKIFYMKVSNGEAYQINVGVQMTSSDITPSAFLNFSVSP